MSTETETTAPVFTKSATSNVQHIYSLLRNDQRREFLIAADNVLNMLTLASGLFGELTYAYKGKEIAEYIVMRCDDFLLDCKHALATKTLQKTRATATSIVEAYHSIEQETRHEPKS